MDKPSIYIAVYAEYLRIQREIRKADKELDVLKAKRETLADQEMSLRCLLLDYGEFSYETYKPKEDNENG